jgi:hypothetical protein
MLGERTPAIALVIVALAASAHHARAQDVAPDAYRQTIDDAVQEFADGHWEEARALFKRAHELQPNARTLRGMGIAAFELRMYVQAIGELNAALADTRKPLDEAMRNSVKALIDKAGKFVGRLRLQLEPADAKLRVDGQEIVADSDGSFLLDVGPHTIGASALNFKPSNLRVNIEGDTEQSVRLQLEPLIAAATGVPAIDPNGPAAAPDAKPAPAPTAQPTPAPAAPAPAAGSSNLRTFAWVALAGAASFGIASGVFWAVGGGQYDDAKAQCETTCDAAAISSVETSDTLATVFLGLALASGATAGVLFALDAGSASAEHAARGPNDAALALRVAPGRMTFTGRF